MSAPVTRLLVFVNIGIHILITLITIVYGMETQAFIYNTFALTSGEFFHGAWWQPVTSTFLHAPLIGPLGISLMGIFHVGVNMMGIWSLGQPLEKTLGSSRFAMLYFVSGALGSLLAVFLQNDPFVFTCGASGAVLGLLGAVALFFPNAQMLVFFFPMKARTAAIGFAVVSLFLIWTDSLSIVSHWGHLGGLVGGFLYSKFVLRLEFGKQNLHSARPKRPEEVILEQMQKTLFGNKSIEKEINAPPEENIDQPSEGASNGDGKRLYYDPITGKFYFKD